MNTPKNPSTPATTPNQQPQQSPAPVNPDPKSHPIHREVPTQPIHEGTDPKQPVTPTGNPSGAV